MSARFPSGTPASQLILLTLVFCSSAVAGCSERREAPRREPPRPRALELRHRFEPGRVVQYASKTVERGAIEITIEMQTRWKTLNVRPDGSGEVEVTVTRYDQRAFPHAKLPREAVLLNKSLAGAKFRMAISADGRDVEHLGHEGVPEVSDFGIEALRTTLRSAVLRLPEEQVHSGKRWTVERHPPPDAGPGGVTSRSRWRVLSTRPRGEETLVELVCLSTMTPGELRIEDKVVQNRTEFHYQYVWNATKGLLEGMTSSGSTSTLSRPAGEEDGGIPRRERVSFEASLRLLSTNEP